MPSSPAPPEGGGGVGGTAPLPVDPMSAPPLEGGRDGGGLLVAEQPALAGVRIQPGDGDAGTVEREALELTVDGDDRAQDPLGGDEIERLPQRDVHRHQR